MVPMFIFLLCPKYLIKSMQTLYREERSEHKRVVCLDHT